MRLVGGVCMRTDIDYLHNALRGIADLPDCHIRGTAFFQMAVMACLAQFAVIQPIPTDGSLESQFVLEHQVPPSDSVREALDLFGHAGTGHDLPVHRQTILKNSILCKGRYWVV